MNIVGGEQKNISSRKRCQTLIRSFDNRWPFSKRRDFNKVLNLSKAQKLLSRQRRTKVSIGFLLAIVTIDCNISLKHEPYSRKLCLTKRSSKQKSGWSPFLTVHLLSLNLKMGTPLNRWNIFREPPHIPSMTSTLGCQLASNDFRRK